MSNRKLFKRAFREASPSIREKSWEPEDRRFTDEYDCSVEDIDCVECKRMTESIDRLTESARQDSFSSIRSASARQQFRTALSNLQTEVFPNHDRNPSECEQNTIIRRKVANESRPRRVPVTTTTVQYDSAVPIPMESRIRDEQPQHVTRLPNHRESNEDDMIDVDSAIGQTVSTASASNPIVMSSSNPSGNHVGNGNGTPSSYDSEDSNGFVRIDRPSRTDPFAEYVNPFDDASPVSDSVDHDSSEREVTSSDETSSLSSDMDQHQTLPKASEIAESAYERVADAATTGFNTASEMTTAASDATKSAFGSVGDTAHGAYGSAMDTAMAAEDIATATAHDIFGAMSGADQKSTGAVHDMFGAMSDSHQKSSGTVHDMFGAATDATKSLQDKTADAAHAAYGAVDDSVHLLDDKTHEMAHSGSDLLGDTIHLMDDKTGAAYNTVTGVGHDAYGATTGMAKDLYGDAKTGVHDAFGGAVEATHEAAAGVKEGAHDVFGAMSGVGESAKQKAFDGVGAVEEKAKSAYGASADAAHAVTNKGYEAFGSVERKLEDEYDKLSDAAHETYGTAATHMKGATESAEHAAHGAYSAAGDAMKGAHDLLGDAVHTTSGVVHAAEEQGGCAARSAQDIFGSEAYSVGDAVHDVSSKFEGMGEAGIMKVDHTAHGAEKDFDLFDPLKKASGDPSSGLHKLHDSGSDSFQDHIRTEVAGVHDQVDSLIQKMNEDAQAPAPMKASGEPFGMSAVPNVFGRGSSPDEQTFERTGPLEIPHTTQSKDIHLEDDFNDDEGFGAMAPRPPTPPKEMDDQETKPTSIDVGPPPPYKLSVAGDGPRSILKHSQGPWVDFKTVDPRLLDLIYWRDPKKSAVVLGVSVVLLLVFASYPLISVLSYLGLAVLGGTLGFRLYKIAEAQLKKTDGANPFQPYLEKELTVPQERVHQQVDVLVEHGQVIANKLRRILLVENICETAKFGLLLWALTYVGSWFSGLCIVLLVVLGVFTIPKVYETYQEPIDHNLDIAKQQITTLNNTMNEKLPFLKKLTGCCAPPAPEHDKSN